MDRMPIACVHCAKAKAKCDKKVPCTRCVNKQITCQSRATRRSAQQPKHRNHNSRCFAERGIRASAPFQTAETHRVASPFRNNDALTSQDTSAARVQRNRKHHGDNNGFQSHLSSSTPVIQGCQPSARGLRESTCRTTPEMKFPATPTVSEVPQSNRFWPLELANCDIEADFQFFGFDNSYDDVLCGFDLSNSMCDLSDATSLLTHYNELFLMGSENELRVQDHMWNAETARAKGVANVTADTVTRPFPSQPNPSHPEPEGLNKRSISQGSYAAPTAQGFWPLFRCSRIASKPQTLCNIGHFHLEGLFRFLRTQKSWATWLANDIANLPISLPEERIKVMILTDWSHKTLLVKTQGILQKALKDPQNAQFLTSNQAGSFISIRTDLLTLPPPSVIQIVLQNYVRRYESYYPLVAAQELNPNFLLRLPDNEPAAMLLLLMIAAGAATLPTSEARLLASGLTEVCRRVVFECSEKNILLANDVLTLQSALLLNSLAMWSGDTWHTKLAMAQRGTYLVMLTHSVNMEEPSLYQDMTVVRSDPRKAWEDWKERESRRRLTCSWLAFDQEVGLFSDTVPLLSVVDFHMPVPDKNALWHATCAAEWLDLLEQIHGPAFPNPRSIRDIFECFIGGELIGEDLTPTHMRLLLHPLQAHICQMQQLLLCLSDPTVMPGHTSSLRTVVQMALEEFNALLSKWYAINKTHFLAEGVPHRVTYINLVVYHLISLNTMTNFKCIEALARGEARVEGPGTLASWLRGRCIDKPERVNVHCGQILRLIRLVPECIRPPWWPAAVYRVALTLWASIMSSKTPDSGTPQIVLDALEPEDGIVDDYVTYRNAIPALTTPDGKLVPLSTPKCAVLHCIEVLSEEPTTRLAEVSRGGLEQLLDDWIPHPPLR